MSRKEEIYVLFGLIIAIFSCIGAYLALPQIQEFISSKPTVTEQLESTGTIPRISVSPIQGTELELLLKEYPSKDPPGISIPRYTEPDKDSDLGYVVPGVWSEYRKQHGMIPLVGGFTVDLEMLWRECHGNNQQGSCIIGRQLNWDCKMMALAQSYPDIELWEMEYCGISWY